MKVEAAGTYPVPSTQYLALLFSRLSVGGGRQGERTGRTLLDYNLEPHLNLQLQHPSSRLEPLHGYTANKPAHPAEN